MDYELIELVQPTYGSVNAFRVGDTLVDTGHVCEESRDRLRSELDGGRLDGIDRVVLTHPHIDHVGGSLVISDVTSLPHVVFRGADRLIREYREYVVDARQEMAALISGLFEEALDREEQSRAGPDEGEDSGGQNRYFPLDIEYATDEVVIDRVVDESDTVHVGRYDCEVVHTPGHSHQHMALYHEQSGIMLSGDILSTNGHFMYGPIHWDVGEYKLGLQRIADRDPSLLLPGHGPPVEDPAGRVADALEKAERTEEAILTTLEARGQLAAHQLATEALDATEATRPFLTHVASAYAVHLADRGLVAVDRRPYVVASPA